MAARRSGAWLARPERVFPQRRGRLAAGGLAALAAALLVCAAPQASAERRRDRRRDRPALDSETAELVGKLGDPRPPAYIRSNELVPEHPSRFRRAPHLQSAHPGGRGSIVLDPDQGHYLWAMDAAGTFYVAPYEKYEDGSESIGHPMLVGGRPLPIAGELHYDGRTSSGKDRWVMDSDSGRYVKPYSDVHPGQLKAARRLVRRIAITSRSPGKRARAVRLHRLFVGHGTDKPAMRRIYTRARGMGGYLLIPPKGAGPEQFPSSLRRADKRAAWQRAAVKRLGRPRPSGRRTR